MTRSSKIIMYLVFGLLTATLCTYADDKTSDKNKKNQKENPQNDTKIIIDSGTGQFDWTGKKTNYSKRPGTPRKEATQEAESKVICPACNAKDVPVLTVQSQRIAIDYDFCEHFIGDSPYIYDIWTCSVCGYASYRKIFETKITDTDKAFVKKNLTETMHKDIQNEFGSLLKKLGSKPLSQKIIPAASKVKNLVAFIEYSSQLDEKWKAYYYVRAVYAMRNLIAQPMSSAELSNTIFEISKTTDSQLKIPEKEKKQPHTSAYYLNFYLTILPDYKDGTKEKTLIYILTAQCFNRLGYYTECVNNLNLALENLTKLKDMKETTKSVNDLKTWVDLERQFALKAVTSMKDALENKADYGDNLIAIVYLVGELSRRCEFYEDAYLFLSASKQLFPEENPIHQWATDHLKRKELKNDAFLLLTPPTYLKEIVIHNHTKE